MPRGRRPGIVRVAPSGRSLPRCRDAAGVRTVNNDRRCLVIDPQPTVRLGVREALADRYEVAEATPGPSAIELLPALGDFDVAIVDLCRSNSAHLDDELVGTATIQALR